MPQAYPLSDRQPIRQLATHLANQIAAGEVIERPASIVKELLENSLDAGATRINILLEQGGLRSVTIQDDGCGIPTEELPLALAAHATSKISHSDDLAAITSLGFRGEALASISAVSRLQLTSRFAESERAWMILGQHDGTRSEPVPAAHPPGTSVTIRELFFNTPARRRFLRSARTEYRHCEEVIRRLALARFECAFSLQHNRRSVFNLSAVTDQPGRDRRVARLCGEVFLAASLQVDFQHTGLRLHGWLGQPDAARPQADLQYFFVNGRIIRDRIISHALRQAFARCIYPGRHPAYILYLDLDPAMVDVNVHPTKHEVRFQQGRLVHDFLVRCVEEALAGQGEAAALPYARQKLDWHTPAIGAATNIDTLTGNGDERLIESSRREVHRVAEPGTTPFSVLGIVQKRYLLLEIPDGILVADVTRWYQEVLSRWFTGPSEERVSRPLLIPLSLEVGERRADCAATNARLFELAGFDLDRIGKGSLLLRRSPAVLEHVSLETLIPALLDQLGRDQVPCGAEAFFERLAGLATSAVGWQVSQIQPLMSELKSMTDPRQHPAVRLLDGASLARLFSGS